ncbi:MAG: STAS domain-containing protein [Acidimicrobiales bacterium]
MNINVDRDDAHVVVTIEGELDAHNCAELGETVLGATAPDARSVVIDASDLGFIDSSAISELLRVRQELVDRDGELTIRNAGSSVRRVLEITGLLETFGVT